MADKNRWCVQCGETGNAGMGAVGLYKSGGAGTVRNVHAMCGRRALEFATAGGVSEVMLLTWPTNRIDEERHVSGPEVLKALAKYIAEMDEEQVAAHGGVEARLLECTQGIILPHVLRDGTSGPASCLAVEWDELVAEARLIWHEQVQEREALRAVEGGGV
jgi:hypothetical protein